MPSGHGSCPERRRGISRAEYNGGRSPTSEGACPSTELRAPRARDEGWGKPAWVSPARHGLALSRCGHWTTARPDSALVARSRRRARARLLDARHPRARPPALRRPAAGARLPARPAGERRQSKLENRESHERTEFRVSLFEFRFLRRAAVRD